MATLRQLTTRFSFETDKRGINEFTTTLSGMRKTVKGVALALGAGVAAKAAIQLGVSLESAAVAAGRMTSEVKLLQGSVKLTGQMAEAWKEVTKNIPGRVNMAPFLRSFVEFRQTLKDRPLEDFNTLFEVAGKQAVITGENVEDVFKRILRAGISADFDVLREIFPNFDVLDKTFQSYIQNLLAVDPSNVNNVNLALDKTLEIARANQKELGNFAKRILDGTVAGQFRELGRNIKEVGATITKELNPPMTKALGTLNRYFNRWLEGKTTIKDIVDDLALGFKRATSGTFDDPSDPDRFFADHDPLEDVFTPNDFTPKRRSKGLLRDIGDAIFGPIRKIFPAPERPKLADPTRPVTGSLEQRTGPVVQNATFNVTISGAQSPRDVLVELERAVANAALSFPPIEGVPS